MLAFFLRRLLWIIPTLGLVSVVSFFFLSLVPDPEVELAPGMRAVDAQAARRERFVDLPRFLNLDPHDVRFLAKEAVRKVAAGGSDAPEGARELVRLGAAALPAVVPLLDSLAPEARTRVALALLPVARRMHAANLEAAGRADLAVSFWERFWDERRLDFERAGSRTAVDRLYRHRTSSRAAEVEQLDTFALPELIASLTPPTTSEELAGTRALVAVLVHVTEREDPIADDATLAEAGACVRRWQSFAFVYALDYAALDGTSRIAETVLETRYGKWAHSLVSAASGKVPSPALRRLQAGAPITLLSVYVAIFWAYSLSLLVGAISAVRRGRRLDLLMMAMAISLFVLPPAVVGIAFRGSPAGGSFSWLLVFVVALGLLASPSCQQRSQLIDTIGLEHVRAARARGASTFRVIFAHALPFALIPVATLAFAEAPLALSATFVAEKVFGVGGLGTMTVDAFRTRDVDFMMALCLVLATIATASSFAADVAHAWLDPRMRHRLTRGRV